MEKRWWIILGFFLTAVLVSLVFVSASGTYDFLRIREGSQTLINLVVDWAEPFIRAILGGNDYTGEILFIKVLLFVLFFAFIWLSLSRVSIFREQKAVKIIICFIVPILSLRYMDVVWINTILTNYQVLGIAVTSIIPFIIFFFFINNIFPDNSALRKMGWTLFIVIYFGLYVTNNVDTYSQVYFWTGIVGVIFLLMDGTIHRIWLRQLSKENMNDVVRKQFAQIEDDIKLLSKAESPGSQRQIERLRREQAKLMKMIK